MKKFARAATNSISNFFYCLLIILITSLSGFSQNVGINTTGAVPNASAGLDVDFSNMGLLIPRVALTGSANFAPLAAHVAGMMVFNTATVVGDVTPGFYYNDGSKWITGFPSGNAVGNMLYWNGTAWILIPAGMPGQYLLMSAGIPIWGAGGVANASILTTAASAITDITATSGANITSDGGSAILSRGVCWGTTSGSTIANSKTTDGSGTGSFTSSLTGLTIGTTYYIRAYTLNSTTVSYGNEVSFTTVGVIPTLALTSAATAIGQRTATTGGNATITGGSVITERGICYATTTGPTTASSKIIDPTPGLGSFVSNLLGLSASTTYYIRSYAVNASGTAYGSQISFTTLAPITPVLAATTVASAVTLTTATSGGNVTSDGGAVITERGVCYATTANPTTAGLKVVDGAPGTGSFVSNLSGLSAGKLYYVRAYAINSIGTNYGTQISFSTLSGPPTLVTVAVTNISGASATSGATMNWNGGGYSNYSNYGVAYSTTSNAANPTYAATNSGNGAVNPLTNLSPSTSNLTGLAANTTYYVRSCIDLYSGGWIKVYGNELSFTTTAPSAPVVTSTTAITGISDRTANSGGAITSDGGSPITAKGVCWGISANPVLGAGNFTSNGTGTAAYSSAITGLTGSTIYHVRAYATNGIGTSYGTDVSFTTWAPSPYTIGQNLGWGYVASVDATGAGYIVSPDILPTAPATTFTWGCNGTHVAVGTALGTGKTNTDLIIATCGANTAAGAARAYNGGGYNDWFLPSSIEFQIVASSYTLFGFSGGYTSYFTSSEYGTNYNSASSYFYTGSQAYGSGSPRVGDTYTHAIRAMRSFIGFSAPTITTDIATNISSTGATSGGNIASDGGVAVTARGVCWSTTTGPTIALTTKTNDGSGTGAFASTISGLTSGITYHVRAYATNSVGTTYGNEISFMAVAAVIPTLTTDPISVFSATGATTGGNITADGGALVSAYGVVWNTVTGPTITTNIGSTNDLTVTGPFPIAYFSNVTGLTPGTTYHIRAYATNSAGTAYGNEITYTPVAVPVVTTNAMGSLVGALAEGSGTVESEGASPVTAFGLVWSTSTGPTILANTGITTDLTVITGLTPYLYNRTLSGLILGTTYYVRAYATNVSGTGYGAEVSFVATAASLGQIATLGFIPGIVFNIDATGLHGLIADYWGFGQTDWGCSGTLVGASGTAVGTGMANTTTMVIGCPTSIAAFMNGPDWYIPSKDEMNLLWTNRAVDPNLDINMSAAQGFANFWSSSEFNATNAWSFNGTTWVSTDAKTTLNNVWPIRSF